VSRGGGNRGRTPHDTTSKQKVRGRGSSARPARTSRSDGVRGPPVAVARLGGQAARPPRCPASESHVAPAASGAGADRRSRRKRRERDGAVVDPSPRPPVLWLACRGGQRQGDDARPESRSVNTKPPTAGRRSSRPPTQARSLRLAAAAGSMAPPCVW